MCSLPMRKQRDGIALLRLNHFAFHVPPGVISVLDRTYHVLHWLLTRLLWEFLVLSLIGGAALSYITTGTLGLADLRTWPPIRFALHSPLVTVLVLLVLVDLYLVASLAHQAAHPRIQVGQRLVERVRDVDLHDVLLKLGPNVSLAYFPPPQLDEVRRRLRHCRVAGGGGLLLTGMPGVGKTRLALECLRLEVPDDLILVCQQGDDVETLLDGLHGRHVVVLLDDLPELASTPEEARVLIVALHHLQQIARRVIVVGTLRSSPANPSSASPLAVPHAGAHAGRRARDARDARERARARNQTIVAQPNDSLRNLTDHHDQIVPQHFATLERTLGTPLELTPFRPQSRPWTDFLAFVTALMQQDPTLPLSPATFDGTPGSVFLGLDERVRELQSPTFPPAAQLILRALAMLHAARITPWSMDRVREVAQAVFDECLDDATWEHALAYLHANGWVLPSTRGILRVPTEAYLTHCVPRAGYPVPPRRIADDFPALAHHLLHPPHDREALLALGDALCIAEGGSSQDQRARVALAVDLIEAAQRLITKAKDPEQWARGQAHLGRAYSTPGVRDAAERQQYQTAAIDAYTEALEVWTAERFPVEHATVLADLGNVYQERDDGDDIERAIACYQEALTAFTPDTFPAEFVELNERLSEAFASLEETPVHLAGAIAALEATTQVIRRDTAPQRWAATRSRIGDLQYQRGRWDVAGFDAAVDAYTDSLEVVTEDDDALLWALITNDLGAAYLRRERGDERANLDAAIACCRMALKVLTPVDARYAWAMATTNLASALMWYAWGDTLRLREEAIALLTEALAKVSPEADATLWADLCSAAGEAYRLRVAGERGENRKQARRYLDEAQAIQRREDDDEGLAPTAMRLAELLSDEADEARSAGQRTLCRRKRAEARTAYEVALGIFTEQDAPVMHREVVLAVTQLERHPC